jgi:hypothetical protein
VHKLVPNLVCSLASHENAACVLGIARKDGFTLARQSVVRLFVCFFVCVCVFVSWRAFVCAGLLAIMST